MKLVRYSKKDTGEIGLGSLKNGRVYRLTGDPIAGTSQEAEMIGEPHDVQLLAPCVPSKIVCVAINFAGIDHFDPNMSEPMVFVKPPSCICGPEDAVVNPFPDFPWWGEAELAVVIKRRMSCVSESEAADGILGFTIANDTTVENVEHRDHHLARSKCPDRFCAVGPWIDTDFDATDCLIEAVQNGEVIRRGRSGQQFWQWPKIISAISSWMTLEPWDLILTGNPPDTVGMRYLNHGDVYTARIQGLGELTNTFYVRKR